MLKGIFGSTLHSAASRTAPGLSSHAFYDSGNEDAYMVSGLFQGLPMRASTSCRRLIERPIDIVHVFGVQAGFGAAASRA